MHLFAQVEPVPADQVFAIGYKHLRIEATDNPPWDMIRDALIHSVAIGGRSSPTDDVSALMVTFPAPATGSFPGHDLAPKQ